MDSRLAGIAVLVLILSTAAVLTLAMTRHPGPPLVMLQNTYPGGLTSIAREGERFSFAYSFFPRRDISELEIRFSLLHSSPAPDVMGNRSGHNFTDYLDVVALRDHLGVRDIPVDRFDVDVDRDPEGRRIRAYDVSRAVYPFCAPASTDGVYSVFGVLETKDGETAFLRGVSDFFYRRERNVEHLVVARGKTEMYYKAGGPEGSSMRDAPKGGVVILKDVKKGEMVVVEFSVVPHAEYMPERTWNRNYGRQFFQIVRAYVDGELVVKRANRIGVDLT